MNFYTFDDSANNGTALINQQPFGPVTHRQRNIAISHKPKQIIDQILPTPRFWGVQPFDRMADMAVVRNQFHPRAQIVD